MLELGEDAPARAESTCDHQDFAPKELPGIPAGAAIQILILRSSPAGVSNPNHQHQHSGQN